MNKHLGCESCGLLGCDRDSTYPDFCITKNLDKDVIGKVKDTYNEDENINKIMKVASEVESGGYLKLTRVEETVEFIKKMDYKLVGIATCISFISEVRTFCKILEHNDISYRVACCKVGAIDKSEVGIPDENRIFESGHESMCNPILQAEFLHSEETDFNIVFGLCVGHDTLFYMHSKAPVTTMIVKDRVTCHNPIAPLHYTKGIYSKLLK